LKHENENKWSYFAKPGVCPDEKEKKQELRKILGLKPSDGRVLVIFKF